MKLAATIAIILFASLVFSVIADRTVSHVERTKREHIRDDKKDVRFIIACEHKLGVLQEVGIEASAHVWSQNMIRCIDNLWIYPEKRNRYFERMEYMESRRFRLQKAIYNILR